MTKLTSKQIVLAKYPEARGVKQADGTVHIRHNGIDANMSTFGPIGTGTNANQAWNNAAKSVEHETASWNEPTAVVDETPAADPTPVFIPMPSGAMPWTLTPIRERKSKDVLRRRAANKRAKKARRVNRQRG